LEEFGEHKADIPVLRVAATVIVDRRFGADNLMNICRLLSQFR